MYSSSTPKPYDKMLVAKERHLYSICLFRSSCSARKPGRPVETMGPMMAIIANRPLASSAESFFLRASEQAVHSDLGSFQMMSGESPNT